MKNGFSFSLILNSCAILFLSGCAILFMSGCATTKKEPKVNPAVIDSQYYFIDNGMPIREVKDKQEFFFKKCSVDNSGPYPAKTNYDCNDQ
jgi:hypothetical protein